MPRIKKNKILEEVKLNYPFSVFIDNTEPVYRGFKVGRKVKFSHNGIKDIEGCIIGFSEFSSLIIHVPNSEFLGAAKTKGVYILDPISSRIDII